MLNRTKEASEKFLEIIKKNPKKKIQVISHFDTDGITAAAIMIKTLQKLDKSFSVKIIKQLEENLIYDLPKDKITFFLDLASGSIEHIKESNFEQVFILDHHEISMNQNKIPENIEIVNPCLRNQEEISGAGVTYLFCKELDSDKDKNKELADLAVIGMIGDMLEKNIGKLNNEILNDAEIIIKKGLLVYPSTRPLNKALEYCSNPYIPGVTGSYKGALNLVREANIEKKGNRYKCLTELDKDEMSRLITSIIVRRVKKNHDSDVIGNIYLVKLFNRLEDAREMSAIINACSRLGYSEISLLLCLGNREARKKAETIYASYKQHIISALNYISATKKIEDKGYVIINAKNHIKDTIIGTIASIISKSSLYEDNTIIIGMAYYNNKIKVSARIAGNSEKSNKNVREILEKVVTKTGGEVGGHPYAAGCLIDKKQEQEFISELKKNLEIEVVKI